MATKIRGILIEHNGEEYLLTSDGYPDLRKRTAKGTFVTIKKKGPGGMAGATAADILTDLGEQVPGHTQTNLRSVAVVSLTRMMRRLFLGAWGG